jgi:hypothetical protein
MSVYAEYSLVIDHCLAIAFEVVFYACFGVIVGACILVELLGVF